MILLFRNLWERQQQRLLHRKIMREYIKSFIYAAIVFVLMYIFLWPVRIVGVSMEPALNNGDRIFVSRAMAFAGAYNRDDLVMIRIHDGGSRYIIKRIIAGPGDLLIIENGQIVVNDGLVLFDESNFIIGNLSLIIPDYYYFLMGDNHSLSVDSRDFGAVHRRNIRGRVLFRFMGGSLLFD